MKQKNAIKTLVLKNNCYLSILNRYHELQSYFFNANEPWGKEARGKTNTNHRQREKNVLAIKAFITVQLYKGL